jgi:lantibiotic biosynthesis protein
MTNRDDASAGTGWRPILSVPVAEQALQAVDAIAESIASSDVPPGGPDPSLCRGQAGLALFHTWLARTGRTPQADVLAWKSLEEAIDGVSTQAMNPSLWGGFTGVAWAAELVDSLLDPDPEDRNEAVDEALLGLLSRADSSPTPYDLVVGHTGLGVYALQRYPRPAAIECLRLVVERLSEGVRRDEDGFSWWTPPEEILDQEARKQYPTGRADLGVAHGMAGVIALLGSICGAGVEEATARPLLEGAVRWLLAHSMPTQAGPTFPLWVAPGYRPWPARSAWCYGDPGIAAALFTAARGAGDPGWEQAAVALACRAAERPPTETGIVDACFCHGTAGLAHIYNRMYQATGEPKLGQAASYWLERTLDFYRLARSSGESWVQGSRDPARQEPWTGIDVVDGAAGVALVLLAAATSIEPIWDRMFLVSAPGTASRRIR